MKTGNERFKGSWVKEHTLKQFRLQCKKIAEIGAIVRMSGLKKSGNRRVKAKERGIPRAGSLVI